LTQQDGIVLQKKKRPPPPEGSEGKAGRKQEKRNRGDTRTKGGYPPHATSFLDIKKKSFINTPLKEN